MSFYNWEARVACARKKEKQREDRQRAKQRWRRQKRIVVSLAEVLDEETQEDSWNSNTGDEVLRELYEGERTLDGRKAQ